MFQLLPEKFAQFAVIGELFRRRFRECIDPLFCFGVELEPLRDRPGQFGGEFRIDFAGHFLPPFQQGLDMETALVNLTAPHCNAVENKNEHADTGEQGKFDYHDDSSKKFRKWRLEL